MSKQTLSDDSGRPVLEFVLEDGARIRKFRLGNGLGIIVWEDHQAPVAALQTWFSVGSGHEVPGRTGMAHLFEHLMFKETANLREGEFDRLLELNGVTSNAGTWLDWTYYTENLPSQKLPLVMRLEADRMQNMVLSRQQLDTEREVVINERRLTVDNSPDGKASELLYCLHFGEHPYGHPTIGFMEDIGAIELEDCVRFYRHYYAPNNATIVVVGDVSTEQVLELAEKYYACIERHTVPEAKLVDAPVPESETVRTLELSLAAPQVNLLYGAPSLAHRSGAALRILNQIMFNSESARVRKLLVEDEETAVDVMGWYGGFRMAGVLEFQLSLVPGADWRRALSLTDRELDRLVREGCSERELAKGQNRIEIGILRTRMSVASRARHLGHYETTTGDFRDYFAAAEKVAEVSADEVREAAAGLLLRDRRTVVAALPKEEPQ